MNIERQLRNYMPYMEKFGIINGKRIAQKLFPNIASNEIVTIRIPQAKHHIHIRLGTTDVANFQEIFLFKAFPLPGLLLPKLIIDAGANAGYASLFFLNKYEQAKVIAVEPEKSNIEILNKNCSPYPNFHCIPSAIWKSDGFVKISNPDAGKAAFQIVETTKEDTDSFSAITIEKILNESGFDKIGILKLDIEGTEKELFEENYKKWINDVNVLIIELHDRFKPGCALAFYSAIEKHNFTQYAIGANLVYIKT